MRHRLKIVVCDNYLKEVEYVIKTENLENVELISYPSNCMKCMVNNKNNYGDIIYNKYIDESDIINIFCTVCRNKNDNLNFKFNMCYSILAGETLVNNFNQQGFYILTPGWLINWKKYVIDLWGFDSSTAKVFFKESANKLMLLDSGLYDNIDVNIKEFSDFVSLDYTVLPIGVEYFRNYIMNIYLKWQNKIKEKVLQEKNKSLAEFSFILDMILEINKLVDIEDIINRMFDLFVMLTGASKLTYFTVINNEIKTIYTYRSTTYDKKSLEEHMDNDFNEYKVKQSKKGFILKIKIDEGIFDYLDVDNVASSENVKEYIKLSTYILKICSVMICKRKEYYKLIKSKIELEQENKAKNIFIANISHELRTPINVLYSGIQLFESMIQNKSNEYLSRSSIYLRSMKQNCFRLLRLVNNVIDITKIEANFMSMNVNNVNIVNIIEEIALSVAQYANAKQIYVEFDTEYEEIIMSVDIEKIDRIFFNLLSNAVKFTKQGGSIFVYISIKNNNVILSVRDTGVGIPEDKISQIFDRFVQVENTLVKTHEGSGIGLAIVKSLVEMHNGKISVVSNVDTGTEFIIELPITILNKKQLEYEDIVDRRQSLVEVLNLEFSDIYLER